MIIKQKIKPFPKINFIKYFWFWLLGEQPPQEKKQKNINPNNEFKNLVEIDEETT